MGCVVQQKAQWEWKKPLPFKKASGQINARTPTDLQEPSRVATIPLRLSRAPSWALAHISPFLGIAFLPINYLWLAPAQKRGDPPGNSYPQESSGFRLFFHKQANVQVLIQKYRYNLAVRLTGNIPHVGVSALAVSRGARNTRGGGSAFLIVFGIFLTSLWM